MRFILFRRIAATQLPFKRALCLIGTEMKLDEFIENVIQRPGMYMADGDDIRQLELMLYGYDIALKSHGIENDLIGFNREFGDFVYKNHKWSTACGWADAIQSNTSVEESGFKNFLVLFREFRRAIHG